MQGVGKIIVAILVFFLCQAAAGESTISHASPNATVKNKSSWNETKRKLESLRLARIEPPKDESTCGISSLRKFSTPEKAILTAAVKNISCVLLADLSEIRIFDDQSKPRALAGAKVLELRSDFFVLPESEKVLIHELGHIVDLSGLKSKKYRQESGFVDGNMPIYADDPSVLFYIISWSASGGKTKQKADSTKQDFVTGYAMTDPFEDFAESFLFYLKQGNRFRAYAEENERIRAKYEFFKTRVFGGQEFATGTDVQGDNLIVRNWDATKL